MEHLTLQSSSGKSVLCRQVYEFNVDALEICNGNGLEEILLFFQVTTNVVYVIQAYCPPCPLKSLSESREALNKHPY